MLEKKGNQISIKILSSTSTTVIIIRTISWVPNQHVYICTFLKDDLTLMNTKLLNFSFDVIWKRILPSPKVWIIVQISNPSDWFSEIHHTYSNQWRTFVHESGCLCEDNTIDRHVVFFFHVQFKLQTVFFCCGAVDSAALANSDSGNIAFSHGQPTFPLVFFLSICDKRWMGSFDLSSSVMCWLVHMAAPDTHTHTHSLQTTEQYYCEHLPMK